MHQCIDIMSTFHGDKQGKQYYIWVDRISSAPIGSDTWLLKFDKWEICGEVIQSTSISFLHMINYLDHNLFCCSLLYFLINGFDFYAFSLHVKPGLL